MKPHLPASLFKALLATCVAALTTSTPLFAAVPEGYEPVIITNVNQLANYTSSDYIAFIISSDITNNAYRMEGAHQYWGDDVHHSHLLTFEEIESDIGDGAISISSALVVEGLQELLFSQNVSTSVDGGAAIYASSSSDVSFTGNGMVTFSGNNTSSTSSPETYSYGGAIYGGDSSNVTLSANGSVTFSGNHASSSNGDYYGSCGGAIYGESSSGITLSDNESVTFSENTATSFGGAIYGGESSTICLEGNNSVTFNGNSSSFYFSYGGAIYGSGCIILSGNGSVTFRGNHATSTSSTSFYGALHSEGGAISGTFGMDSDICIESNESVMFSENYTFSAHYYSNGGAISSDGNITLSGNGSVTFRGNYASASEYSSEGGAIYGGGNITLSGNGSVTFRGNYEQSGSDATYRLRSVYMTGNSLTLAAGEGQSITFYDTLYAKRYYDLDKLTVSFNAAYQDKDGMTRNATGDIVFSGKYAEEDLKKLKPNYTQQELTDSLTTVVYTATNLYGGQLRIEDGAIYEGCGINVAEDSNATLRLANGTLHHAGYNVALTSGATLDLQGANMISAATLDMQEGSILSFALGETNLTQSALTLDGIFNQGGNLTISIQGNETYDPADSYMLISMESSVKPEMWDIDKITLSGADTDVNHLKWENGVLYYRAQPPLVVATWTGCQSRLWNNKDWNWTQGGYNYHRTDGADVVFGDTGCGNVILEEELAPASVSVNNSTNHDYIFTGDGKLTGGMQLTKEGDGTLTIGTANEYTGGTIINGGVVVVDNATALGGGDVVLNGGELVIATDATLSGQITVEGDNYLIVEDGCTLSLGYRIANNYYLEMWGAYDISNLSSEVLDSGFVGGEVKGNGFVSNELQVQVVDSGFGAYAEMNYASFLYNGIEGEAGVDGEVLVTEVDGSVFYVNSGTESVSQAYKGHTPSTILMKSWTCLELDVPDFEIPNIELAANEGRVGLNVYQDTTIEFISGGDESFIIDIGGTSGKTLTLIDASGYVGAIVFLGGAVTAGNATAFGAGKIYISSAALNLGGFEIANAMDFEGNTTIGNGTLTGLLSAHNATLQMGSEVAVDGTLTTDGTCNIEVVQDATLTLGKVVQNTGDLALSGMFDISALSSVEREPEYIGGITKDNGFFSQSRDVKVVNNTQGGTSNLTNGFFLYNGETVDSVSGGTARLTSVDYSRFFVFSGEEYLGNALDASSSAGAELEGITMSAGTTLHVNRDMSADFVSVASGRAKLDIAGSCTVTESAALHSEFILTGGGIYALAADNAELAPTLDSEGWTGTVALKDVVMSNPDFLDLDSYGHEGSAVRLDGVKTNFGANGNTFSTTLELTGAGLEITACQGNRSYEFAGGVKGDGNFIYNLSTPAHNQTYIFSGNVSEWTGAYVSAANKTSTLEFTGDATVMGADIIREQGIVNVVVGNGSDAFATTFGNVIIASSLKVLDKAAATLTKDTTIAGGIEVAGGLKIQGEGQLNVGDSVRMGAVDGVTPATLAGVDISSSKLSARGEDMAELSGLSITTMEDFKLENVRLDGSFIDIGEDTTFYIKNVEISADTRITDGAAHMFIEGGKAFLDESNTEASAPTMSLADVTFYRSGDTETWMTLRENVSLVSLTSELFTKVMLTGTDLWLDLTGLSAQVGDAAAFSVSFEDGALFDVDSLRVYATLNGEKYLDGYTTHQSGGATTLYFSSQIPEPATGTLSLLAFAALAAWRKRK